ncbi:MAG: Gfo/Idh/MocA family oxidoreductase [Planctomycetaceae bacterium]|nr:Gfo/Idh/MocA family oxidoreductase [Planctomycetaceae bacterium]
MSGFHRRDFLKRTAAASTTFSLFTIAGTRASGKVLGANETIRVGVAGINGRGQSHIDGFCKLPGVEVTYLIDPDSRLFEPRSGLVTSKGGNRPQCVQDIRQALDDKNLDAVSVATCNHWHSLITIWACQAGKDVYVEKPLSHNVFEGRQAVAAARKHGRVVQHGTQSRSSADDARDIAAVHSGKYGKLLVSKGYSSKPRWSINRRPNAAPPAELDFNLWLGPAPEQPYHENLVHYNWHWFWDTGNGEIGNQGVHQMDLARWAIRDATLPKQVWSLGGRFFVDDQGQTPNTQMAVFDYGDVQLVFEVRGLVEGKSSTPRKVTNEYYTDQGMISEGQFYPRNGGAAEPLRDVAFHVEPGGPFGNFIDAVRSRSSDKLNAEVLEGHYSSALCHLANISYRLGTQVPFNPRTRVLGDNAQVVATYDAIESNLRDGLGLKLGDLSYQLGRILKVDAAAEKFIGDDEANRLLTRDYRKPFVVPETI